MKVTIRDIAKVANVSVTAVSLVLNNRKNKISQAKKEEIFSLVKKHDYVPNFTAQNLVSKKSKTIGMIIPDIENFFFNKLVKVVEDYFSQNGYSVIISNSNDSFAADLDILRNFHCRDVDGMIITVSNESYDFRNEMIEKIKAISKPFVLVDRIFDEIECNKVSFDNRYGGYLATKYLIEKGYKEIACVTTGNESENGKARFKGYQDALKEYNIAFRSEYVFPSDYRFNSGYKVANEIFKIKKIQAIVASNDLVAYGIIKRAKECDVKIPEDIEVVGYDNLDFTSMLNIEFTSVEQDVKRLGTKSAEILHDSINNPNHVAEQVVYKPTIKINK